MSRIRTGLAAIGALIVLSGCQSGSRTAEVPEGVGARTPPTIVYQVPFRVYHYITDLSAIQVTFSEPVTGVRAEDLTVNGSPASRVEGSGEGPYGFAGYAAPEPGPVTVRVAAGSVRDVHGNRLLGTSWTHTLIDPDLDLDGDGVRDGDEAERYLTNPTMADTDGDGLPDGFEIAHDCLDPLADQAHPHDFVGNPIPGTDDADGDGFTDAEELALGSDPCSTDSP